MIKTVSVFDLYRLLCATRDDAKTYSPADITEPGCDTPAIDVRLQVYFDGSWCYHTGDVSYDQDHRGCWGCGSVSPDDNAGDLTWLAKRLINECAEAAVMHGANEELEAALSAAIAEDNIIRGVNALEEC